MRSEGAFPQRIFGFDGVRGVLGTYAALVYIDAPEPPTIGGRVALRETPLDAQAVGGDLHVTSDHGLTVISPPCPAPQEATLLADDSQSAIVSGMGGGHSEGATRGIIQSLTSNSSEIRDDDLPIVRAGAAPPQL